MSGTEDEVATFAWLCDVFVAASHRGRGIATWMLEAIDGHPDLQGIRRWSLATRDAHTLYARFGWTALAYADRHMERTIPNAYIMSLGA